MKLRAVDTSSVCDCVFSSFFFLFFFPPAGLEWDDDFSAVEKSSHFQHGRHSASEFPTPPTPGRFLLSQRCLFLTHVTESDLTEL